MNFHIKCYFLLYLLIFQTILQNDPTILLMKQRNSQL